MSLATTLKSALAALLIASPTFAADIMIMDPYARASSPSAKAGAAFMMIHNHGASDRLIDVTSPAAKRVQLHTHLEDDNGIMKMMHVEEGFELPENGMLSLARGGHHVMFMGLTEPFEQDAMVPVTLIFEKAGEVEIEIPVDLERQDMGGHGSHSN